jgi:hypothetical protein
MTTQTRRFIELADILGMRFDCRKSRTSPENQQHGISPLPKIQNLRKPNIDASRPKTSDRQAYKRNQKEKQWWLSLAYALGRLRVRSLAPLEKTRGFGMTPTVVLNSPLVTSNLARENE